jgi:hypothetical protein
MHKQAAATTRTRPALERITPLRPGFLQTKPPDAGTRPKSAGKAIGQLL